MKSALSPAPFHAVAQRRRMSRDLVEVALKFERRDSSVRAGPTFSLGMTSVFP